MNGHYVNDLPFQTSLLNINKFIKDDNDYIPSNKIDDLHPWTPRNPPPLTWFVASYKDGRENMIKAQELIEERVGRIPEGNLKRYGNSLLIESVTTTQSILLSNFKASSSGNIKSISPHRSFNCVKGIIYSRELYEFSEEEILERCPPSVYQVRKFRGNNNTILLTFSVTKVPDYITFGHVRIGVRKYRPSPNQCHNCFEYGHILTHCQNKKKCYVCSLEHESWDSECTEPRKCFLCEGITLLIPRRVPKEKI